MRRGGEGLLRCRERSELFDTAEADAVSFSEGPVNGSRFGNTHFGAPHHGRNVRRIGIAVADEALGEAALIDDGFEDPPTDRQIGELILYHRLDSATAFPGSKLQEPRVGHIPSTLQQLKITRRYGERIPSRKVLKPTKGHTRRLAPQLTREPCIGAKANNTPLHETSC